MVVTTFTELVLSPALLLAFTTTHLLMLYQLFGVGALAHRGLPPLQGACAEILPRTAPP